MKLHSYPLLFLINFTFNSSVSGIDFSYLKQRSLPYQFFLFVLLRNHQSLEQVGKIIQWKKNLRAHKMDFAVFSRVIRN